jgi:hypothetical protein
VNDRIYFMVLGDDGGAGATRGIVGIVPAERVGNPFVKRVTQGVPDFPTSSVKTALDVWVTLTAGLAMGSQGALSILESFGQLDGCQE